MNLGNYLAILFDILLIILLISFFFVKRNSYFGIRNYTTNRSDEIWHKVHVKSAILTIPFIIVYTILIFVKMNLFISCLINLALIFIYINVCHAVSDYYERLAKKAEEVIIEEEN